ncbi:glutaredoxin domain-containing cysteine-rich protein CG31559 [Drosophila busckii]|uniref:glutaredoxin domain-containing cysteine-rich protein CG31559 n=1 Tax=Drosophila busckii TaxID=30019 RepID=UPI00083EE951|nr:glutaredoxin domain-containing cysteine-rich protein CG31559 [Drosophila busckii]
MRRNGCNGRQTNCYLEQYEKYATHCETADSGNGSDLESNSDSLLNCSSTEYVRQAAAKPSGQLRQRHKSMRMLGAILPDSLLRDIRDRRSAEYVVQFNGNDSSSSSDSNTAVKDKPNLTELPSPVGSLRHSRESLTEEKIEELRAAVQRANFVQSADDNDNEQAAAAAEATSLPVQTCNSSSNNNYKYADDQFYSFHINEHENFNSLRRASAALERQAERDVFAGYRDVRSSVSSTQSTIRSAKGTVRGVKNRVRNGIATFLQLHQQPNVKCYKEKDVGKVVLYTTSMGVIRDTYTKCATVKQILRTLLVKFEERDVFMSIEYQAEMRQRMQSTQIRVPQLFVEGQHIGDAETVERLNESGELRQLLTPYKSIASTYTCQTCGGYRLLPCPSCNGSKKSVHRNHFTAEFVALKCMNCDEVGLVKCHNC